MAEPFDPNRPLFSQRQGIEPLPELFKLEHLSTPLTVELTNVFESWIDNNHLTKYGTLDRKAQEIFQNIFSQLDSYPKSQIDVSYKGVTGRIRRTHLGTSFNRVLDFLEVCIAQERRLTEVVRYLFDKHKAAYGLIESDGWYRFVPRTSIEDTQCLQ